MGPIRYSIVDRSRFRNKKYRQIKMGIIRCKRQKYRKSWWWNVERWFGCEKSII